MLDHADAATLHLLFTDVVLPGGMSGLALAEAFSEKRPGLPVLFTSGHARNITLQNGMLDVNMWVLGKPYTLERLAASIREAIDRGSLTPRTP
jgi:DNA-binding NtrC family response regulator